MKDWIFYYKGSPADTVPYLGKNNGSYEYYEEKRNAFCFTFDEITEVVKRDFTVSPLRPGSVAYFEELSTGIKIPIQLILQ